VKVPRWYTRGEVAAVLQVDPTTVTRYADAGKLPFIRLPSGLHRRYDADAVDAFVVPRNEVDGSEWSANTGAVTKIHRRRKTKPKPSPEEAAFAEVRAVLGDVT
jgi:excisionase family DNA binding protein